MRDTNSVSRESVAELLSRQVVVPEWMRRAVAGLDPEALVDVQRFEAPFGSYVLSVRPVRGGWLVEKPAEASEPRERPTQEQVNRFLDQIREEGVVNMLGAAPAVASTYGLTKAEARAMLHEWMRTYRERHPQ